MSTKKYVVIRIKFRHLLEPELEKTGVEKGLLPPDPGHCGICDPYSPEESRGPCELFSTPNLKRKIKN